MDSASLLVQTEKTFCLFWVLGFLWLTHNYYIYMASFVLSRYHIRMTSGLVLNVIC